MEVGSELFISLRIHRNNPANWNTAKVVKATKRFIHLGYPYIKDKRIPLDSIIDGALVGEGLIAWFPSKNDRERFEATKIRLDLESKITKIRWGDLSNDVLRQVIELSRSKQCP